MNAKDYRNGNKNFEEVNIFDTNFDLERALLREFEEYDAPATSEVGAGPPETSFPIENLGPQETRDFLDKLFGPVASVPIVRSERVEHRAPVVKEPEALPSAPEPVAKPLPDKELQVRLKRIQDKARALPTEEVAALMDALLVVYLEKRRQEDGH